LFKVIAKKNVWLTFCGQDVHVLIKAHFAPMTLFLPNYLTTLTYFSFSAKYLLWKIMIIQ